LRIDDNPEENASLGGWATTRLPQYSNPNVYCRESDPRTFGHQYGNWAEMTDCCHPIELH
jgi:hypothetical protein